MKIYAALYNPCIHESTFGTISLHKSKRGAEIAMEFHKEQARKEWQEMNEWRGKELFEFGVMESWRVEEIELKD